MRYESFKPGQVWTDTNGNRIQAHAGCMLYENGTYFWYGENKEKSLCEADVWHWGVRLYSSKDLYNWEDEGIILFPELKDETSPLHFKSKLDRPHILFNEKTGLYVMWVKIMTSDTPCYAVILTSKSIKGPFKIVKKRYNPNGGFGFGDFELLKDENNGKAYLIYEKPHTEMIITPLTEDYLGVEEDNYRSYFQNGRPPFVREAPATFSYNGKIFMITSGTTGKFPNRSEIAVSDSYMGEWKVLGELCEGDVKGTTFDSQISCVFKVAGKDLFIAMADRWLVDLPEDLPDMHDFFVRLFDDKKEPIPFSEFDFTKKNTSMADYVWLPIEFKDGRPFIRFRWEWKWENFV